MDTFLQVANYIIEGTEMSYTSIVFVCLAFLLLGVLFLLRNQTAKMVCILLASLGFYAWSGGTAGLCIILLTALIVYVISRRMETIYTKYDSEKVSLSKKEAASILKGYKKRARRYLYLALLLTVGVWIYVKVGRLYVNETAETFRDWFLGKGILVPLGISYYTLSSVGYLLDIYWRRVKPEHNFLYLLTAISYFPHIVQGPIARYDQLIRKLRDIPKFEYKRVCFGLQLAVWGYIKKIVIADRLAMYTGTIFASPGDFAGIEILLAVVLSVIELYADFSGCMDIVGGISQAIGIDLTVNFKQPFFAKSASEFWRRWHITLGDWTRDYIYVPITVNAKYRRFFRDLSKKVGSYLGQLLSILSPMLLVWLFTGLWHGTGWDYIVWGLYWFVLIIISIAARPLCDKICSSLKINRERKYWKAFQCIRTSIYFGIGRMFTVAGGLAGCGVLWRRLFSEARLWTLFDGSLYTHGLDQKDFYVALVGIILMLLVDIWHEGGTKIRETIAAQPLPIRWVIYIGALVTIAVFGIYGSGYDAASFIYGAF